MLFSVPRQPGLLRLGLRDDVHRKRWLHYCVLWHVPFSLLGAALQRGGLLPTVVLWVVLLFPIKRVAMFAFQRRRQRFMYGDAVHVWVMRCWANMRLPLPAVHPNSSRQHVHVIFKLRWR